MDVRPIAFVDEFGGPGLDLPNGEALTHFIITAVIVEARHLGTLERQVQVVRQVHFQGGQIKSSKVGQNHDRRARVLRDLCRLPFKAVSVVVDKRELKSKGFRYPYTFRVNLHNKLYDILFNSFPNIRIVADRCGDAEFQRKCRSYVNKRHPMDLFSGASFEFVASESEVMVQVADFVSGSLARHYDHTKRAGNSPEVLAILGNTLLHVSEWPPCDNSRSKEPTSSSEELDDQIAMSAYGKAVELIRKFETSDDEVDVAKAECLHHLIDSFDRDPERYVSTDELLGEITSADLSPNQFRLKIIGPLRDAGAVLSSCDSGYKIPHCESDLTRYLDLSAKTIEPMLRRIESTCRIVKIATLGRIDLLERRSIECSIAPLELRLPKSDRECKLAIHREKTNPLACAHRTRAMWKLKSCRRMMVGVGLRAQ